MSCHTEQILSLAEIGQHFADQWVLVRLTDVDKYGSPVKGVVIFHSSEQQIGFTDIGHTREF